MKVNVSNRRRFSGGTRLYPWAEGDHTSEPHHWSGEGAMEVTQELESNIRDAYPILFEGNSEDEE